MPRPTIRSSPPSPRRYEGTHEAAYYGIEPTHKKFWFTSCDIFRIADGRIVEHWGMEDIAGIIAQLKG